MAASDFTVSAYRELVAAILARGYEIADFHSVQAGRAHLVMRHDVDQSLSIARVLADLETANGWRSSWFVLVRTEMYNPFSRASVAHLREMRSAGHEIGLHLDATCYDSDSALERGCATECEMLEQVLGAPVRVVSFHRPLRERLGGSKSIAGRMHTYMDRFFTEMGYCSDSRGEWRHGHPLDHPVLAAGRALQLLTHAVWWVGPPAASPRQRLEQLLAHRNGELRAELAANNDVWLSEGRASS